MVYGRIVLNTGLLRGAGAGESGRLMTDLLPCDGTLFPAEDRLPPEQAIRSNRSEARAAKRTDSSR